MAILTELKNSLRRLVKSAEHVTARRVFITIVIFVIVYVLLAVMYVPSRIEVEEGRPSPQTVYAPEDMIDEYSTEKRREEVAEEVQEVYTHDPAILEESQEEVEEFFDVVFQLKEDEDMELAEQAEELQGKLGNEISSNILRRFLQADKATLQELKTNLEQILEEIYQERGVKEGGVEMAQKEVSQEIGALLFNYELKKVAERLLTPLIQPNMLFNPDATAEKIEEALAEVEPVMIHRGTRLLSEGETVTEEDIARLEAMGLLRGGQADYMNFLGLFLFLVVVFFTAGIYLYVFNRHVFNDPSLLTLMGLILVITLIFALAVNYFSYYLMPIAAAAILTAVLFGNRAAILVSVVLAILVGLITNGDVGVIMMALVGSFIAIVTVSRLSGRMDLVKAGLYVALANAVIIITNFLLFETVRLELEFLQEFGYGIAAGMGNGLFSAMMAIGLLPFLESGFGLTTSVTLLELSNPNQPLLRQLLMKAPGTYHHSIVVGNLAEAAAEEVDADPLLTRVGAYYHDIGKTIRPYFFTENQFSGENPHEKLSPNMSALVISAHVKDGLEMARKENLPAIIQDIIQQHHGTGMISYFYHQALQTKPDDVTTDEVTEENFRYEGPLPQTKEAAIIMLADIVEAGVRSLSNPTKENVAEMVQKMIKDKLNDEQLDECDLTLRDIDKIENKFIHTISGVYHKRMEYPVGEIKAEMESNS